MSSNATVSRPFEGNVIELFCQRDENVLIKTSDRSVGVSLIKIRHIESGREVSELLNFILRLCSDSGSSEWRLETDLILSFSQKKSAVEARGRLR